MTITAIFDRSNKNVSRSLAVNRHTRLKRLDARVIHLSLTDYLAIHRLKSRAVI
jgi:hypothetical protein